jgi:uncharacterized protein DUF3800
MPENYIAYIDEAGDEGFGKLKTSRSGGQSKWLVLGACLVRDSNDKALPNWRNEILNYLGKAERKDLHFRTLKHEQKVVACKTIAKRPLGLCMVMSNKSTIQSHPKAFVFKRKGYLYNYLTRFLLERLTSACAKASANSGAQSCQLKIVFSRRAGTNYQTMNEYLRLMRDGKEKIQPVRSIDWNVLDVDAIRVENHSKWAGLQIADVTTSAFFAAVEPNAYGNYEPRYAFELARRLISDGEGILNCGLTPIPQLNKNPIDADQKNFFTKIQQIRQAPGLGRPPAPDSHRIGCCRPKATWSYSGACLPIEI